MEAGVVGWPIAHSLSPLIHNAWIAELGLNATYSAYPINPEGDAFERFVQDAFQSGCAGLNITAPFKERAVALGQVHGDAQELGNANVLAPEDHGEFRFIRADNTDQEGLLSALRGTMVGQVLTGRRAIILGAGAAARTAAVTLQDLSVDLLIVNRTFDRGQALARAVGGLAAPWAELHNRVSRADILINATSATHDSEALDVDLSHADIDLTVIEMSYRPLKTPLLRQAEALGLRTVDGLAMLIGQARPSFKMFFGVAPPSAEVVDVRALCMTALEGVA